MMKPKMMVHPSQARTIDNPAEVERLLAMGWLIGAPRPKTKDARRMRVLRAGRRAEGWLSVLLWLTPDQAVDVKAALRPSEGYADLLLRLVSERSSSDEYAQVVEDD